MWTTFYSLLKKEYKTKNRRSRNKCQRSGKIHEDLRDQGRRKDKKWWRKWKLRGTERDRARERRPAPIWQFLPSFFSPKAEEWGENEECFKWILKVREGTAGHICVGYLIWRDSHLQPHLSSNLRLTRIDSFCASLLNPSGIQCICKCAGRFRVKREEGR